MAVFSCAGTRPTDIGVTDGHLAPCPSSPNCVSSDADADDSTHYVAPFVLATEPAAAWKAAETAVAAMPRTEVVTQTPDYLYAECTSALMGFVDDLELQLRAHDGVIAVRSASRIGYGDMGVNRTRIEDLRSALLAEGAIKPAK
jgi:uncharacterized protein (DUF1499 family)